MMSLLSGSLNSLPSLNKARLTPVEEINQEFKSGASYKGQVQGNARSGRGLFIWPNGATYEGEYIANLRQGKGIQTWPDGTKYIGDFHEDMRHGQGKHTWPNGEIYEGTFFKDRRHGPGSYTWSDDTTYEGTFYMDRREGYGCMVFSNGNKFEGLYKCDQREGPGVLTYPDGKQDVGLWHRQKLVKLCTLIPKSFSLSQFPDLECYLEEKTHYIEPDNLENKTSVIDNILNPPGEFNYEPNVNINNAMIFSDALHPGSLAADMDIFEQEFFKDAQSRHDGQSDEVNIKAWNMTPSSVYMQRHVLRHTGFQHKVSFNVDAVLAGQREGFGDKGPLEIVSESLIEQASAGNLENVANLLNDDKVSVDVTDANGNSALLGAAVNWYISVINCLLDNGADVNKLNNEGISSLSACHVHFYRSENFRYNIAEPYLEKPDDYEQEERYDVEKALGNYIPTPKPKSPDFSKREKIDVKHIERLRKEYSSGHRSSKSAKTDLTSYTSTFSKKDSKLHFDSHEDDASTTNNRKLGTLNFKRSNKVAIEDMLNPDSLPSSTPKVPNYGMQRKKTKDLLDFSDDDNYDDDESESQAELEEFDSMQSIRNLPIEVSDQLIERCATQLSSNTMVVSRSRSATANKATLGTTRRLAIDKSNNQLMEETLRQLLKRGADPNASSVPIPVLFFAVKSADVEAVRALLMKGASTQSILAHERGGLTALHIAAALPGNEGVAITELLLDALADPDARAAENDMFLNTTLADEWSKDVIPEQLQELLGGMTPLHIACARDDNYKRACKVVRLLLQHHADPNLLCNGHSALSLAIMSGNDLAIDELLLHGADPCLPLTHGNGSALCVASSTEYETRRKPEMRIKLIDKLIAAGADILAPIPIGPKRLTGSAVDYAYYLYNLDRRIAHMPYHALTHAERETFNARRELLAHLGDILREQSILREKERVAQEKREGRSSRSPSPRFTYTGTGRKSGTSQRSDATPRKSSLRFCYDCGRSIGVRLSPCTRCKEVFYCSKACKLRAWNMRHKDECVRQTEPVVKFKNQLYKYVSFVPQGFLIYLFISPFTLKQVIGHLNANNNAKPKGGKGKKVIPERLTPEHLQRFVTHISKVEAQYGDWLSDNVLEELYLKPLQGNEKTRKGKKGEKKQEEILTLKEKPIPVPSTIPVESPEDTMKRKAEEEEERKSFVLEERKYPGRRYRVSEDGMQIIDLYPSDSDNDDCENDALNKTIHENISANANNNNNKKLSKKNKKKKENTVVLQKEPTKVRFLDRVTIIPNCSKSEKCKAGQKGKNRNKNNNLNSSYNCIKTDFKGNNYSKNNNFKKKFKKHSSDTLHITNNQPTVAFGAEPEVIVIKNQMAVAENRYMVVDNSMHNPDIHGLRIYDRNPTPSSSLEGKSHDVQCCICKDSHKECLNKKYHCRRCQCYNMKPVKKYILDCLPGGQFVLGHLNGGKFIIDQKLKDPLYNNESEKQIYKIKFLQTIFHRPENDYGLQKKKISCQHWIDCKFQGGTYPPPGLHRVKNVNIGQYWNESDKRKWNPRYYNNERVYRLYIQWENKFTEYLRQKELELMHNGNIDIIEVNDSSNNTHKERSSHLSHYNNIIASDANDPKAVQQNVMKSPRIGEMKKGLQDDIKACRVSEGKTGSKNEKFLMTKKNHMQVLNKNNGNNIIHLDPYINNESYNSDCKETEINSEKNIKKENFQMIDNLQKFNVVQASRLQCNMPLDQAKFSIETERGSILTENPTWHSPTMIPCHVSIFKPKDGSYAGPAKWHHCTLSNKSPGKRYILVGSKKEPRIVDMIPSLTSVNDENTGTPCVSDRIKSKCKKKKTIRKSIEASAKLNGMEKKLCSRVQKWPVLFPRTIGDLSMGFESFMPKIKNKNSEKKSDTYSVYEYVDQIPSKYPWQKEAHRPKGNPCVNKAYIPVSKQGLECESSSCINHQENCRCQSVFDERRLSQQQAADLKKMSKFVQHPVILQQEEQTGCQIKVVVGQGNTLESSSPVIDCLHLNKTTSIDSELENDRKQDEAITQTTTKTLTQAVMKCDCRPCACNYCCGVDKLENIYTDVQPSKCNENYYKLSKCKENYDKLSKLNEHYNKLCQHVRYLDKICKKDLIDEFNFSQKFREICAWKHDSKHDVCSCSNNNAGPSWKHDSKHGVHSCSNNNSGPVEGGLSTVSGNGIRYARFNEQYKSDRQPQKSKLKKPVLSQQQLKPLLDVAKHRYAPDQTRLMVGLRGGESVRHLTGSYYSQLKEVHDARKQIMRSKENIKSLYTQYQPYAIKYCLPLPSKAQHPDNIQPLDIACDSIDENAPEWSSASYDKWKKNSTGYCEIYSKPALDQVLTDETKMLSYEEAQQREARRLKYKRKEHKKIGFKKKIQPKITEIVKYLSSESMRELDLEKITRQFPSASKHEIITIPPGYTLVQEIQYPDGSTVAARKGTSRRDTIGNITLCFGQELKTSLKLPGGQLCYFESESSYLIGFLDDDFKCKDILMVQGPDEEFLPSSVLPHLGTLDEDYHLEHVIQFHDGVKIPLKSFVALVLLKGKKNEVVISSLHIKGYEPIDLLQSPEGRLITAEDYIPVRSLSYFHL